MLKKITKAIMALGALCVILENNQGGARILLALAVVAFTAFALYPKGQCRRVKPHPRVLSN